MYNKHLFWLKTTPKHLEANIFFISYRIWRYRGVSCGVPLLVDVGFFRLAGVMVLCLRFQHLENEDEKSLILIGY